MEDEHDIYNDPLGWGKIASKRVLIMKKKTNSQRFKDKRI